MTNDEFEEIKLKILKAGIHITLYYDTKDSSIWCDLNTEMKSELHISYQNGKCVYQARYDDTGVIQNWEHLLLLVAKCTYGRD